ncbi:MAG TPA: acetyl-CoA C-acyltransferase [Trebonia sp.]|jgi:acetyl-CoA C-acetyltransferase
MPQPVIVAGARTPIGKMLGALAPLTAPQLGGLAIGAALERAGVAPGGVDAVVMGNVVQAGLGPNPAKLAAAAGGIPVSVSAATVNKVCLSGLMAIAQAAMYVRSGQYGVVVAGGMESMSNAPYLVPGARSGLRYGGGRLLDSLEQDALVCGFEHIPMGVSAERDQAKMGVTRHDQDTVAAESHSRAVAALKEGRLAEEITPVTVAGRMGDVTVDQDEGVRPGTTAERLAALPAAFSEAGSITAGNASQLSDGAAAVVVTSREHAERAGLPQLAEIGTYGTVAGPDFSLMLQPANAIRDALRRDGTVEVENLSLLEINEAFAGVAVASTRDLGVSPDLVNVNGGAVALGHPVGMSGARLVLTLALELRRRGGGTGVAALCGSGGQGDALLLHAPAA